MAKRRTGLHKEISSIFDGVPIPGNSASQEPTRNPAIPPIGTAPETTAPPPAEAPAPTTSKPRLLAESQPKPKVVERPKPVVSIVETNQSSWRQNMRRIKGQLFGGPRGPIGKQKMMVLAMPVLFIILIIMLTRAMGTGAKGPIKPVNNSVATMMVVAPQAEIKWQIPEPYPTTMRDPMQLPAVTSTVQGNQEGNQESNQEGNQKIIISGIFLGVNPSAYINGNIVHKGDKVAGATIIAITRSTVEFELNGKTWDQRVKSKNYER